MTSARTASKSKQPAVPTPALPKKRTQTRSVATNSRTVDAGSRSEKRPAGTPNEGDPETHPRKKQRTVGPAIKPTTTSKGPTSESMEDQEANSDNEYVGMFDEEEQEVEEQEEEVDQLTVIPQWTKRPNANIPPRSTARRILQAQGEASASIPPTLTPVWEQPRSNQVVDVETEAAADPAANSDEESDDGVSIPIDRHNREQHELLWPRVTRLVHPVSGKLSLLAQNTAIQAVVQDAIPMAYKHIASIDSFPSAEDEKTRLGKDVLYRAAQQGGFVEIASRLSKDPSYGGWLSALVDARVCIMRGDIRGHADAAIAAYRVTSRDEADELLLDSLAYIYSFDPWTRKLKEDEPYQHSGIETVLRQSFFIGSDAKLYEGLFSSSITEAPEELEVTIPMVAISATAVHAALEDYGNQKRSPFSAANYEDVYHRHVATLEDLKKANPRAYHVITASLYKHCRGRVPSRRTYRPIALKVAALPTSMK